MNVNPENDLPVWAGVRYIPQVNFGIPLTGGNLLDFEFSANINGSGGMHPFDKFDSEGAIKPYRTWIRYSADRFELRLGLQKINFGSASMLRPLMWFDQVDPRDPLQLTDGVWGLLGRYFFLNNINVWLWGLYGNEGPKTWEIGETTHKTPEFGGRFQVPVPRGEAALSFHHRKVDLQGTGIQYFRSGFGPVSCLPADANRPGTRHPLKELLLVNDGLAENDEIFFTGSGFNNVPENRFGFDAKWDVEIGLWLEAAWIQKRKDVLQLTNQHLFTLGADYTFGVGNGLHLAVEQILISLDHKAFRLGNRNHFTAATVSYPLGIFDNISAIVYRDWTNENTYNFINWQHTLNRFTFYLMAFLNPETFRLPQVSDAAKMFSGKGFQLMLVFNH